MVQQLMREGNMRQRALKAPPTGLMASTQCKLSRTRLMKADQHASCNQFGLLFSVRFQARFACSWCHVEYVTC